MAIEPRPVQNWEWLAGIGIIVWNVYNPSKLWTAADAAWWAWLLWRSCNTSTQPMTLLGGST